VFTVGVLEVWRRWSLLDRDGFMEEIMLSSHEGRRWKELKWKQLARSVCLVVTRVAGRRPPNKPKPQE